MISFTKISVLDKLLFIDCGRTKSKVEIGKISIHYIKTDEKPQKYFSASDNDSNKSQLKLLV